MRGGRGRECGRHVHKEGGGGGGEMEIKEREREAGREEGQPSN